jgi:plasmid stabilization system protein ParE
MHRRLRRSEHVIHDLVDCYRFIHEDDAAYAEKFLDTAEEMFLKLAEIPGLGRMWKSDDPKLARIRVIPLPSPFDHYLVFYREDKNRVRLLRVLQSARDLLSELG